MVFRRPADPVWLRWVPWLQVGAGALLILFAFSVMRADMRAQRERLWSAMARELAHQMGTPLSSLSGWVEVLQLTADERERWRRRSTSADVMQADVERLERVSRRFELIGKPPALERIGAADVVNELGRTSGRACRTSGRASRCARRIDPPAGDQRQSGAAGLGAGEHHQERDRRAGRPRRPHSFIALRGGRPPAHRRSPDSLIWLSRMTDPALRRPVATASSNRE
jgi:hypothetical protein